MKKNNNEKIAIIKFILYSSIFPLFSVPALQLLGVLPQSVMKATLSKLVEPQEQGKNQLKNKVRCSYIMNYNCTSRLTLYLLE